MNKNQTEIRYGEAEHPLNKTDAIALLAARFRANPSEHNKYGIHSDLLSGMDAQTTAETIIEHINNQGQFTSFTAESMLRMNGEMAAYILDEDNLPWFEERSSEIIEDYDGYSNGSMFTTTELFKMAVDGNVRTGHVPEEHIVQYGLSTDIPENMTGVMEQIAPVPIVASDEMSDLFGDAIHERYVVETGNSEPASNVTTIPVSIPTVVDVYARVPQMVITDDGPIVAYVDKLTDDTSFADAIGALSTDAGLEL